MSNPIAYQPAGPSARPQWWPGAVAIAMLLIVSACLAWERSTPALGERALPGVKIWAARCAAVSLWTVGQAALVGVALPAIYRPRPAYAALTALASLVAILAGVSAAALWAAS